MAKIGSDRNIAASKESANGANSALKIGNDVIKLIVDGVHDRIINARMAHDGLLRAGVDVDHTVHHPDLWNPSNEVDTP